MSSGVQEMDKRKAAPVRCNVILYYSTCNQYYISEWFTESERCWFLLQVQQALNNVMKEHTVLVIAHRLSTVEKADNIIVIDRGHVAEQGPHSKLMASGGLYCKLVQRQVLGIQTGADVLPENLSWKPDGAHQRRRQSSSSSASESECKVRYWEWTAVWGDEIGRQLKPYMNCNRLFLWGHSVALTLINALSDFIKALVCRVQGKWNMISIILCFHYSTITLKG